MISKKYNAQMGNYLAKLAQSKPKLTNADRIRAMTDEELATFLGFVIQDGYCYGAKLRDELKIIPVSDHSEMVDWLKQEVDNG